MRGKALGALAIGSRGIGGQLLRNGSLRASEGRRHEAYTSRGKGFWVQRSINDPAVPALVQAQGFDLVINARTRSLFGPEMLAAPALGCINVSTTGSCPTSGA